MKFLSLNEVEYFEFGPEKLKSDLLGTYILLSLCLGCIPNNAELNYLLCTQDLVSCRGGVRQ